MLKIYTFMRCLVTSVALLGTAGSQPEPAATWQNCTLSRDLPVATAAPDPTVASLILPWCEITELRPGAFNNTPNITFIDLRGNVISNVPANVFNLPKLQNITLFYNKILGENISPNAFASIRLKNINLGANDMGNAPKDLLANTPNLEELSVRFGSLEQIPAFVRNVSLPHLMTLTLSANLMRSLDSKQSLNKALNLRNIDLSYNFIEHISEDFFEPLNALTEVDLQHNKLTFLSKKLFQNKHFLSKIVLANNLLEHIPPTSFEGTSLTSLDLSGNKLSSIPLGNLRIGRSKLKEFYFMDNPLSCEDFNHIMIVVRNIQYRKINLYREMCIDNHGVYTEYNPQSIREEYSPFYDDIIDD